MGRSRPEPPRWAAALLRSALPIGPVGESIRGDLRAEYEEHPGPKWRARLWYVVEAVKIVWHYRAGLGVSDTVHDVRYGIRLLLRMPWVTLVAVISLAAGIGATTTMFATMYGFIYAPLPYADQDDLYTVLQVDRASGGEQLVSVGNALDLAARVPALEGAALWRSFQTTLTSVPDPVPVRRMDATPNVFDVLGRDAALGRTFAAGEGLPGPRVGVLTHRAWARHFGADPGIVGRSIEIAGRPVDVVGVMPADFEFFPADVGVVVANTFALERDSRTISPVTVVTSVPDVTSLGQVSLQASAAWAQITEAHADPLERYDILIESLRSQFPGDSDARMVQVMLLVAILVLMIAASNVANVLIAKADERGPEIALRLAMGAGRLRLIRQLLTEALILAAVGGVLGVLFAMVTVEQLAGIWPPQIPDAFRPRAHPPVMAFAVLASAGVAVLFGLAPALHALRPGYGRALGEGGRNGSRAVGASRLRGGLVVGQIALAVALLSGAGAMTHLARNMVDVDLGFDPSGLLTFRTTASGAQYDDAATLARFHREVERSLLELGGVTSVAVMDELPRGRAVPVRSFTVEGRDPGPAEPLPETLSLSVNHGYFEAMGVSLREGRTFAGSDRLGTPTVAVVSQTFARLHFPGESAVGKRLAIAGAVREIVGVVGDVFHARVVLNGGLAGLAYLPMEQLPTRNVAYAVRSGAESAALSARVREAVRGVDGRAPVSDVQTLDAFIDGEMASVRVIGQAMTFLGVLALMLSALGTYGVMAHRVAGRRREIGIRLALGARRRTVAGLVLRHGLVQAALGIVLGLPIAFSIRRASLGIGAQFRADIGGPQTVVWVAGILALVCLSASYLPARKATRVDPLHSLRGDV